ncbi:MAG: TonB-dependent receptor [Hyphomonadaceae bacterium]|nr:TonB-dependent receptor [Hyphomonadaceae bacterium]
MSLNRLYGSISFFAIAASSALAPAYAQETPPAAPAPEASSDGRDVIIITATKREEDLQDVPVVVTAIGQQLLQDAGVENIKDLQILTPGLTVTSTSSEASTTARIRGVGTVGDNIGLESSVLVNVDGVYRPRNGVGFGDLGELQRIEVLKGPQGTLFGKNASAGVINIVTAAPDFDFGVNTELTGGNYGAFGGSLAINSPIIEDVLAGNLYMAKRKRDGFYDVGTGPGPRTEGQDNDLGYFTVRGQLLAEPTPELTARLILDYTERDENCCAATQLFVGQAANSRANLINQVRPGSIDTTATPFDRQALANRSTRQDVTDQGASLQLDYDFNDDISLTSITAVRGWRSVNGQDSDFTAADLVYRPDDGSNYSAFEQVSQEIRAAGEAGQLTWLVGGFYAKEDVTSRSVLFSGEDFYDYFASRVLLGAPALLGLPEGTIMQPGSGIRDRYDQSGESYAIFTENTWNFTDDLAFTLGLRWTRDEKDLISLYTTTGASCDQGEAAYTLIAGIVGAPTANTLVGGMCLNQLNNDFDALGETEQNRSEEAVTGTARIKYNLSPDAMVYAGYARGFKSGGFNLDRESAVVVTGTGPDFVAESDTSFRGEYVDAFEIGSKNTLLNGDVTLNVAVFHQTFKDFQLNTFAGTAFVVETLPEVVSKGVDADFAWYTPWEALTIQGGVTYADTKVSDFTAADLINPARFNSLRRLPGETLSFAPEWSASLAATYEQPVSDTMMFRANLSAKYMSDYNTGSDLHPSKAQEAFTVVNGRIGIGDPDNAWNLELFGQNLFDEDYLQVGFNGPFQVDENNDSISVYNAFLSAPRTYGVTLRTSY